MSTTTLYRMFAADGRLLYVGISSRAALRWQQHRHERPWWSEVATVTVEHFASRAEALGAELTAIREERPAHNLAGASAVPGTLPRRDRELADELQRPKVIGLRSLLLRWPVAERLAEQFWRVMRSRGGTWDVVLVVDGSYASKKAAQEALPIWADAFGNDALILPQDYRSARRSA
jgi:hypothetical protein